MIDLNRLVKIKSHIDHNNNKLPHAINPTPKKTLISHHAKKKHQIHTQEANSSKITMQMM